MEMTLIFHGNDPHFPWKGPSFSREMTLIFQAEDSNFPGKMLEYAYRFLRWRRQGCSRQLPMTFTRSGHGSRPLGTTGSLRNREVIFGFNSAHWTEYQPATVRLAPGESHGVQAARRADWQNGRLRWGAACEGVGWSRVGRCRPACPSRQ